MREHQIIISLKPDQFARIQQMSKEAGAKSMGIFVRKTLLAALDLDGTMHIKQHIGDKHEPRSAETDQQLMQDLRNMHAELKGLIAESLLGILEPSFDPVEEIVDKITEEVVEATPTPVKAAPPQAPVVSSIKPNASLDDLLDERLKARLEYYLEHKKKNRSEPEAASSEPPQQEPAAPAAQEKPPEPKPAPKPQPSRPVPPTPPVNVPDEQKQSVANRFSNLSGNPPPKKPKY